MRNLEEIIKPTLGVFTNIGEAHDQGFENTETKIREKLELIQKFHCPDLPGRSKRTQKVILEWQTLHPALKLVSVGKQEDAVIQIKKMEKNRVTLRLHLFIRNSPFNWK